MKKDCLSIQGIQNQLRNREISGKELVEETLKKIKEQEQKIGAFLFLDEEEALKKGGALDDKLQKGGSLDDVEGALYCVKDNIMVEDLPCTCGSNMLKNFISPYDGESVKVLNGAGGINLGKTNLDEFAMGSSTEHSAFQVTRNPFDNKRVAGGSSGGSAAAVAAGFSHFSLGSDTGGSLRQPAAFCGVLGLKPTYGLVSRHGLISFAPSMDQVGIIANNSRDIARVLSAIRGNASGKKRKDSKDYTLVRRKPVSYSRELRDWEENRGLTSKKTLEGVKIGFPKEFFEMPVKKEVTAAMEFARERMSAEGAEIMSVSIPHFRYGLSAYHVLTVVEALSNLARFDGVAYGKRASNYQNIRELIEKSRGQGFGEEVKRRLILGSYIMERDSLSFQKAKKVQNLLKEDFRKVFETVDLLFTPTTNTTAFNVGKKSKTPLDMQRLDEFTVPASLTGLPAISVPCQRSGELPVGGQLIGNYFDEAALLKGSLGLEYALRGENPLEEGKR